MNIESLQHQFGKIGAQIRLESAPVRDRRFGDWWGPESDRRHFAIDIQPGKKGALFNIIVREDVYNQVNFFTVDVRPKNRHLLLMARENLQKQKFLCGHDERHYFVAAIPDGRGIKSVSDAMEALKPEPAKDSQRTHRVKRKNINRRRNSGYTRQGEWFFLPRPNFKPANNHTILHNEAIQRSGGSAHIVEWLCRLGGEKVYVCRRHPNGLTEMEYQALLEQDAGARTRWLWRVMQRDAQVYAQGKVRHPDHQTIQLPFWHTVMMSTETESQHGHVVFLD